jgi:hypothetical protein
MELTVDPADLHAAAIELAHCSARLKDAESTFASQARAELPHLGTNMADSIGRGIAIAERSVGTVIADIDQLAHALRKLAAHYPRIDATAVARR